MSSPLHQFEIHTIMPLSLAGYDISLTNSSMAMIAAVAAATAFMTLGMGQKKMVPGRMQSAVEMVYSGISSVVGDAAGHNSKPFFPLIFSIFIFILFCNLVGMIPGSFTATSHIIVTFVLAALVFFVVTLTGFIRHGLKFFSLFLPHGIPIFLAPFIFVLEFISYMIRPFSLSLRLFANMLAGHIILKVFAGMVGGLVLAAGLLPAVSLLPLLLNVAMTGFEFFVAVIQAFIFSILAAVYLHDALELH